MKKQKTTKPKTGKPHPIIYIISVLIMLGLIFHSYRFYSLLAGFTFLPAKYIHYLLIGLIAVNAFFSIYAFLPVNNLNKILQSLLSGLLAAALAFGSVIIPDYKGRMERVFTEVPTEGERNINVYVLNDSLIGEVGDLQDKKLAVQSVLDQDSQDYAIKVVSRELGGKNLETVAYDSLFDALDALYSREVDALMMNASYETIVTDNEDFKYFLTDTRLLYTCTQKVSLTYNSDAVGDITHQPFLIMVGGNDQWDYYDVINDTGRTDVNMVVGVNPNTKQILMITIPRDSYLPLWGNKACPDKLTHSTWYGIDCWEETVENMLDIKLNYYIRVGFSSIINIVDAIGGLNIYNPFAFDTDCLEHLDEHGHLVGQWAHFDEGDLYLDGVHALCYCRERHNLSDSDMGRNKHQAIVLKAIVDKVTSVEGITHIGELMDAVAGTFKTDITMDQIYALAQMQLDDMANWSLIQYSVSGTYGLDSCYIMGLNSPTKYNVVYQDQATVEKAKQYLKDLLANKPVQITQ